MALAANSKNWNSPHAGRQLRTELGWIPALWAKDGDVVLVDDVDASRNSYFRFKCNKSKPDVSFQTLSDIRINKDIDDVVPWGWDLSLRAQLMRHGLSENLLPSEEAIANIRKLSGRQITLRMLPYLRQGCEKNTCGEVRIIRCYDELRESMAEWGNVVVKSPWSCSGRGVRYVPDGELTENMQNWFNNTLQQQQELVVEPYHESVMDFGAEFEIVDGKSVYRGLSLFDTANGAYTGSLLATEQEKRNLLAQFVPLELIDQTLNRICEFVDVENKRTYKGAYGVDMMIVRKDNQLLLNPCVELNFRRTMGHTALALSPDIEGNKQIMRIAYEGKHYHIRLFSNENWLY